MTSLRLVGFVGLVLTRSAVGQGEFKAESFEAAPPAEVSAPVKATLSSRGVRVVDPDGTPLAEIWLRGQVPAAGTPSGPKGTVLFPVLAEGEFLGVIRFSREGHDYRDQAIAPGVYMLRYGLQPVNGDHLGVSPFRDYALLLPAAKDVDPAPPAKKKLEATSAEAAGSSHPAVMMLLGVPSGSKLDPSIVRDEGLNASGVILALPLVVDGKPVAEPLKLQLVVDGTAP